MLFGELGPKVTFSLRVWVFSPDMVGGVGGEGGFRV